jgi:hypothetical protein
MVNRKINNNNAIVIANPNKDQGNIDKKRDKQEEGFDDLNSSPA